MKQTIKLNESQLKRVISEAVKRILKEDGENEEDVDLKVKQLKRDIRTLSIELVSAPNSKKEALRNSIAEIEADIRNLTNKLGYKVIGDGSEKDGSKKDTFKSPVEKQYYVSYLRNHEEGASESSFNMTASSDYKQAIQKANDTVESFDSDFGVYLISVYDKMSGKYIYNKNKGRGGYSI